MSRRLLILLPVLVLAGCGASSSAVATPTPLPHFAAGGGQHAQADVQGNATGTFTATQVLCYSPNAGSNLDASEWFADMTGDLGNTATKVSLRLIEGPTPGSHAVKPGSSTSPSVSLETKPGTATGKDWEADGGQYGPGSSGTITINADGKSGDWTANLTDTRGGKVAIQGSFACQ
jgi:hypothetical protein